MNRNFQTILTILAIIIITVFIAVFILSKPKIAWNSGPRQKLSDSLKVIRNSLDNERKQILSVDFAARAIEEPQSFLDGRSKVLVERHGVRTNWFRNGAYESILFYPIATSPETMVEDQSKAALTVQLVMVPVNQADCNTLPKLFECRNTPSESLNVCQWRQMKQRFAEKDISHAAALMSDGSIQFISVDDLVPESRF